MSLHARPTTEAQVRLASQRRASTLTSVVIAILLMVLLGVILTIIAIATNTNSSPQQFTYKGESQPERKIEQPRTSIDIKRRPASPTHSPARVLFSNSTSLISVSVPLTEATAPSIDIGEDGDFGEGFNVEGQGSGPAFSTIPSAMKKRCSKTDRLQRLSEGGGTPKCEEAVMKSLRWLQKTQNADGSWAEKQQVGMTGLALLAYLGHCETAGSEEFGETVHAAITYLTNVAMKNNGKLASDFHDNHWPYEHAIATYALAEAYSLCTVAFGENLNELEPAVQSTGQFIINNQHEGGGWEYSYSEDSDRGGDISIVGWHMQALKACKYTGLDFKNMRHCCKNGLEYIKSMQMSSGAIGYSRPELHGGQNGTTLAAVGALSTQIWKSSSNRVARSACKFIAKEMKFDWNSADSDLYGHYYAVQAMINHGGKEWENYNKLFRDQLLNNQNEDGSYKQLHNGQKINAIAASFNGKSPFATHYRTCLATLMLEVYYRYLPATGQK